MATPRRPAAMASTTSLASVYAVKNFKIDIPHLREEYDTPHEWLPDWGNQQVVDVDDQPHLLIPLRKVYIDPLGLRDLIPPIPKIDVCPLCGSMMVRHS